MNKCTTDSKHTCLGKELSEAGTSGAIAATFAVPVDVADFGRDLFLPPGIGREGPLRRPVPSRGVKFGVPVPVRGEPTLDPRVSSSRSRTC